MIKPGQLVRIGEAHCGLVIKPAPHMKGFPDVDWWYILIGENMVPCLESSLEVISDAR
jgi:hypothetical protein